MAKKKRAVKYDNYNIVTVNVLTSIFVSCGKGLYATYIL